MKKLMNLTEKDLLTVEGGDAAVSFNVTTVSSKATCWSVKGSMTGTDFMGISSHGINVISKQASKVGNRSTKASNTLIFCAY
jgi:hypothetical protein